MPVKNGQSLMCCQSSKVISFGQLHKLVFIEHLKNLFPDKIVVYLSEQKNIQMNSFLLKNCVRSTRSLCTASANEFWEICWQPWMFLLSWDWWFDFEYEESVKTPTKCWFCIYMLGSEPKLEIDAVYELFICQSMVSLNSPEKDQVTRFLSLFCKTRVQCYLLF